MSPDGEAAVDGGRASDAEVMARTVAMVALWARGRPSKCHTRNASSEETHTGLQALTFRYGLHPPMGQLGPGSARGPLAIQDECAV
jgi:hypothetical protein